MTHICWVYISFIIFFSWSESQVRVFLIFLKRFPRGHSTTRVIIFKRYGRRKILPQYDTWSYELRMIMTVTKIIKKKCEQMQRHA